jgi:hypothetical protein
MLPYPPLGSATEQLHYRTDLSHGEIMAMHGYSVALAWFGLAVYGAEWRNMRIRSTQ